MVAAGAAGPYSSKGKVGVSELINGIVEAATAKFNPVKYKLIQFFILHKQVERQWISVFPNDGQ